MKSLFAFMLILSIATTPAFADDVKIMFPTKSEDKQKKKSEFGGVWYRNDKDKDSEKYDETDLAEFVQKFKKQGYSVEQIELWVEAKAETGGITKLFLSIEGKGGCKIILKPK